MKTLHTIIYATLQAGLSGEGAHAGCVHFKALYKIEKETSERAGPEKACLNGAILGERASVNPRLSNLCRPALSSITSTLGALGVFYAFNLQSHNCPRVCPLGNTGIMPLDQNFIRQRDSLLGNTHPPGTRCLCQYLSGGLEGAQGQEEL